MVAQLDRLKRDTLHLLDPSTLQRILSRILTSVDVEDSLEVMLRSQVLAALCPDLAAMRGFGGDGKSKALWAHTKQVVAKSEARVETRWAALFHDVGKIHTFREVDGKVSFHGHEALSAKIFVGFCRHWKILSTERQSIEVLIRHHGWVESYKREWTDSAIRRLIRETQGVFPSLLSLTRADCTTANPEKKARIESLARELETRTREIEELDSRKPLLPKGLGKGVMSSFGLSPGPLVGEAIFTLEQGIEEGVLDPYQDQDYYLTRLRLVGECFKVL